MSKPTWGNHIPIFTNAGLEVRKYRYYDSTTSSLDFENLKTDIEAMPEQSIVLLHACAHNPTGMDPTLDQWAELSQLIKRKNFIYTTYSANYSPQEIDGGTSAMP